MNITKELYRVLVNFVLGILGYIVLILSRNDYIDKIDYIIINLHKLFNDTTLFFLAMLSLMILAGELIALLGESLINIFFEFPLFIFVETKNDIERITPCTSSIISCGDINSGAITEISEIHFVWSRVLGGLFWLSLLFLTLKHGYFYIVITALVLIVILIAFKTNLIKRCWSCFIKKLILISPVILSLGIILSLERDNISILSVLMAILLLIYSLIYRSFANILNKSELPKKENQQ